MARTPHALVGPLVLVAGALALIGCGDNKPATPPAGSETISRASVGPLPANAQLATATSLGEISANARFVAFISSDPALPAHDGVPHAYRYDRQTGDVAIVDPSRGAQGRPQVSNDGATVAFTTTETPSHVVRAQLTVGGTIQQVDVAGLVSADDASTLADMTPDGQSVLFFSRAKNLTPPATETTASLDLYRWSVGGTVVRCTWRDDGAESNGTVDATRASISADGRFVVFSSTATDLVSTLVPAGVKQVYRRDLTALLASSPSLTLVSVNGVAVGNADSLEPDVSGDGLRVSFTSTATNLVTTSPAASGSHVYVADIGATLVIVAASWNVTAAPGTLAGGAAAHGRISQDGHVVAFVSSIALTAGATGGADVYVRDVTVADTRRVTVGASGAAANGASADPSLSADGSSIEFASAASNLIASDTNLVPDLFVAVMPPLGSG